MNCGSKRRIQMGCGEPLQCRWWIAGQLGTRSSGNPGERRAAMQKRLAAVRSGAGCKS